MKPQVTLIHLLVAIALGASALLLVACGTSAPEEINDIDQRLQGLQSQVREVQQEVEGVSQNLEDMERASRVSQVVAAIGHIDGAGLHAMDEGLAGGELNPRWVGTIREVMAVTEATVWPEGLQAESTAFLQAARDLEEALAAEEVSAAAPAARKAHDTQHNLSHAVFAWLSSGGEGEGHGHQENGTNSGASQSNQGASQTLPEGAVSLPLELRENGGPEGGPQTHRVKQGETAAFVVRSTVEGKFHLHGYGLEWELKPGQETVASFEAHATGRFPLEVHVAGAEEGVPAGYLEVRP